MRFAYAGTAPFAELVLTRLAEAGRVPVALVRRRMAERFGERPDRGTLANLAAEVGAVLRGDVIERKRA